MLSKSSLQIPVVSKLGLGERDVLCTEKWEILNSCGIWVQILALHLQAVLAPKGIHNEVAQAGGLKQQTFFISQLWSLEVEIKVWVPPEELQRNLLQVPPPLIGGGLLAVLGVPWLVDTSVQPRSLSPRGVLPRVHLSLCPNVSF